MNKKIAIAVDVGGTNIKFAVVSYEAKILKKVIIPTKKFKSKNALIKTILKNINSIYKECGFKKSEVLGIGIGVPGLVDAQRGVVKFLVNIKGWHNVPLKNIIECSAGIKTSVDNDVNVIALGEYYLGKIKNAKNLVAITLGTGVGGGIILGGKLYRGSTGSAGEIGHIPINEKGPKCNCGGIACLESYVGNNYIIRNAAVRLKSGENSLVKKLLRGNLNKITPEILSIASKKGDIFAKKIWEEVGSRIGIGLAGVVNFLDVDVIVIGGGLSKAGAILFDSIKATLRARAMKIQGLHVKIVPSRLGENAGLLGAAILVRLNSKKSTKKVYFYDYTD